MDNPQDEYEKAKAENEKATEAGMPEAEAGVRARIPMPNSTVSLEQFSQAVCLALGKTKDAIFIRGNEVVEIIRGALSPVTGTGMRLIAHRHVDFYQMKKVDDEFVEVVVHTLSPDKGNTILTEAKVGCHINEIKAVTSSPCYLPGWELIRPGLNPGGYYYLGNDGSDLAKIKELAKACSKQPMEWVKQQILDLIVDFPFTETRDPDSGEWLHTSRDNFVGSIITTMIKPALNSLVPLFVAKAPKARTGKTKLVTNLYGGLLFPKNLPTNNYPIKEEEMEKTLTALIKAGRPAIVFDNVDVEVKSPSLAGALTSRAYSGRILGKSAAVEIDHETIFWLTANNCSFGHDMAGRICEISLTPLDSEPECRSEFVHPDILEHARKNRVKYLGLFASMVERWRSEGCPERTTNIMGSFERWSKTVGGILDVNGFGDFQKGWHDAIASSSANYDLADFYEAIMNGDGKPVPGQPLAMGTGGDKRILDMEDMTMDDLIAVAQDTQNPFFAAALEKPSGASQNSSMGWTLKKVMDTPVKVGDFEMCLQKTPTRVRKFSLVSYRREMSHAG